MFGLRKQRLWHDISLDEARAAVRAMRIVDVREPAEFVGELGHIPGAELVPLGILDAASFDPADPVLVVCRSGRRAASACDQLARAGVSEIHNLSGGMLAWNRAGYETCQRAHDRVHGCDVHGGTR